ncbi:hypothetical protein CK501_06525 [Halovibrio salipaludis]|uniref:N-acetyltransferase domain-containing protein n=1 Tax=Halovibrio salipaludis TaxID=2032626 RepID=A0A2A2F8R6_9GAMM|nr:hypothetical protein CK501_06525 [Halovibrio salipaludis]
MTLFLVSSSRGRHPLRRGSSHIRYLSNRALRRIFSYQRWLVLYSELKSKKGSDSSVPVELRRAEESDTAAIVAALPDELVGHLPREAVDNMVRSRFKNGVPCFLALAEGSVVGGCWCPTSRTAQFFDLANAAEITTLFVAPPGRGRGIGTLLCRYASESLARAGRSYCVSLVWYSRPASVKAHLNAGFKPIGEKLTISLFGIRWSRYSANTNPKRLRVLWPE